MKEYIFYPVLNLGIKVKAFLSDGGYNDIERLQC